jgi:peptidoglycan/xylan/chitin deacetylase (PgdA/CDA1 family)
MQKITIVIKRVFFMCVGISLINACSSEKNTIGQTEICKWQYGKRGAVSITFDGGTINQFRKVLPIMNRLEFPGTFFITTGVIPGSQYQGRFIGRSVETIINETATIPTNEDNLLERSSAAPFLGYAGTLDYQHTAGNLIERGKYEEACEVIDEFYKKVRNGEFPPGHSVNPDLLVGLGVTWDDIRLYATQGHEFAGHTITHPNMAALDEANMLYELEKSAEEIRNQLKLEYVFSVECPYGTENERVMEYTHKVYPASRNRMPEPFLEELNRGSRKNPGSSNKEYVQWQRGARTKSTLQMMKSWIDTTAIHDNIWLVLVFHGVDSIGWEAISSELYNEYFQYMKSKEDDIWIATFADVTKYMRERKNSNIETVGQSRKITVNITHSLDQTMYNIPLTLKTYVPSDWEEVKVKQGGKNNIILPLRDDKGSFVLYQAYPNSDDVKLSKGSRMGGA